MISSTVKKKIFARYNLVVSLPIWAVTKRSQKKLMRINLRISMNLSPNSMMTIIVRMKESKIIRLEGIIHATSERSWWIAMFSSKNWDGDTFQQSGWRKTSNIPLMWLSRSWKVLPIIWRLHMTRCKFFKKLPKMPLILSGSNLSNSTSLIRKNMIEMILMSWIFSMLFSIKVLMVITFAWFSKS